MLGKKMMSFGCLVQRHSDYCINHLLTECQYSSLFSLSWLDCPMQEEETSKKNIDTLSIDDLYNNLTKASSSKHKPSHSSGSYSSYTPSSSKATTTADPGLADEVIHSFLATNADLIHEDLDQIDDLDLEEMDINWQIAMTAIKIKKFYKKTGRRPRVDGKMHVAFEKKKSNVSIATILGILPGSASLKVQRKINWVEQTADEELNHDLM
ncbi:hypothetical protein Tco_0030539, partial [Tanacetum coccineum]